MGFLDWLKKKKIYPEAVLAVLLFLAVVAAAQFFPGGKEMAAGKSAGTARAAEAAEEGKSAAKTQEESQEAIAAGQYPIMGTSTVTAEQMAAFFKSSGETYPAEILSEGGAPDIETFCRIYHEEALAEGVRPEVPFVQAMKETAWLQYGGDAEAEQYNFAGLGTTGGGVQGESFPDVRTGIRAQIQHLKAYASEEPLAGECVDTRYSFVTRGCAPYVEWLGQQENPEGYGWATDPEYGYSIVEMINVLKSQKG